MEALFWVCLSLVVYPYAIYPPMLIAFNRLRRKSLPTPPSNFEPMVSIVLPVHNEAGRIDAKVKNLLALDYPHASLRIIVVGDGCTDDTLELARAAGGETVDIVDLTERGGKAAALNAGLERAQGDVVVFTDAGIMLERQSLRNLVGHFRDPIIGCVSGEDYIEGAASEGLYGRLELLLRREEAKLHSIAGASGCFYGQRRELCQRFLPGMAPDFLSVLITVASGARAIAEPAARGTMTATSSHGAEFARKVRTFLRGMTALFAHSALLNPFRHPAFAYILWSHKLMRWLAPLPMLLCVLTSWSLRQDVLYGLMLYGQLALYALAAVGLGWPKLAERNAVLRAAGFFVLVNAAALKALALWLIGARVEIWQPTRRPG